MSSRLSRRPLPGVHGPSPDLLEARAFDSLFDLRSDPRGTTGIGGLQHLTDPRKDRHRCSYCPEKKNESIVINSDIVITVVEIRGDKVRLGIVAPKDVPVHREEVYEAIHGVKATPPPVVVKSESQPGS